MDAKKFSSTGTREYLSRITEGLASSSQNTERNRAMYLGLAAFEDSSELVQKDKLILFITGGVHLAVALDEVAEVLHLPSITRLPRLPSWVRGIANVRSEIVSVINLPEFFGWPPANLRVGGKMIILQREEVKVGVHIDGILGTMTRTDELQLVADVPATNSSAAPCLLGGIVHEEQVYTFLDVHALLANEQLLLRTPAGVL